MKLSETLVTWVLYTWSLSNGQPTYPEYNDFDDYSRGTNVPGDMYTEEEIADLGGFLPEADSMRNLFWFRYSKLVVVVLN